MIARYYYKSLFSFARNWKTVFQSDSNIRTPSRNGFTSLSVFWILDFLISELQYIITGLNCSPGWRTELGTFARASVPSVYFIWINVHSDYFLAHFYVVFALLLSTFKDYFHYQPFIRYTLCKDLLPFFLFS